MAGEIDRLEINISADSSDAADHINKLAASLESLGKATPSVSNSLNGLSIALGSLKGIRTASISRAADSITEAFDKIGNVPNLSAASDVAASINVLKEATAGLKEITDNIRGLKVGKTFETNLDNLKQAIERLNDISDASNFTGAVQSISESLSTLNNIEVGKGFFNLVEATTQWQDSIERLNENILGGSFSQGIARVARAAEILNDVDFSGFKRMNQALADLPDNVRITFGASSEEIQGLTESLEHLQSMVDSISNSVSSLATKKMTKKAENKTDEASTDTDKRVQEIGDSAEASESKFSQFKNSVAESLSKISDNVKEYEKNLREAIYEKTADSLDKAKENFNSFKSVIRDFASAIAFVSKSAAKFSIKAIFSPLTTVANKFKNAATKAGQFLASIKRIAMYRAVRSMIKAITEGFEEGRKNLYYYSQAVGTDFAPSMDKAATAALYLKNSIGAATAPLTNYLVPMIDKAVDHIVDLINKFNELTAVLTKQSTWTAAVKYPTTWQDALDDANKSAKKLKSTMLGFDELNVIEPASAGVKAKAFDMDDYSRMFKEMQTSATWQNQIPDFLIPVKLAWDAEGDNTIRTIKNTWKEILELIGAVGESFRTVWMNGTGQKSLELILQITQEIVGVFGALAKKIREAWQENDKGTKIIQSVWNVANNLLTVFRDIWSSIREWAENLDWNPLLESLGSLFDAIDKLTAPESGAMVLLKALFTEVLEPLGKWVIESALPLSIEAVASAVEMLDTAFDSLVTLYNENDVFKSIVDTLKEIGEVTFTNISGLIASLETLLDVINGTEVSDKSAEALETASEKLHNFFDFDKDGETWYSKLSDKLEGLGESAFNLYSGDYLDADGTFKDGKFQSKKMGEAWGEKVYDLFHKPVVEDETPVTKASIPDSMAAYNMRQSALDEDPERVGFFKDFFDNFNDGMDQVVEKWESFKANWVDGIDQIKEAIANSAVVQLFTDMKDSAEQLGEDTYTLFNETIPNAFTNAKTKISDGWDSLKKKTSDTWDSIKNKATSTWDATKKSLSDGWNSLAKNVTDFKNNWVDTFENVGAKTYDTWESVKGWLSDHVSWEVMKGKVSDFAETFAGKFSGMKDKVGEHFSNIKKAITGFFDDIGIFTKAAEFRDDLLDIFNGIYGRDENSGIRGIFNKVKNAFTNAFDNIYNGIKTPINAILNALETVANGAIDMIAKILNGINSLTGPARAAFEKVTDISIGGITWNMDYLQLPRLANGGMVESGQLFLAREAGPELVAQYGGNTGVMNNQQIVKAVSDGVYRAVTQAMAQQTQRDMVVQSHIYLDRKELTSQVQQQTESNGVNIFGDVVYT